MILSSLKNVNKTKGISMILDVSIGVTEQNVNKTKGISMILNVSLGVMEPNRDPVLQDQKVLPEVRNRPLLPREYFSHSTFRNSVLIQ